MNVIQEHIDYLDKSIKTIREIIDSIIAPYESAINLLCSIPGIDRKSAITIISKIAIDMSQFSSHYRLAIARKILVAIYHMLSTGELFNLSDASKIETSDKDKIKFTKNN